MWPFDPISQLAFEMFNNILFTKGIQNIVSHTYFNNPMDCLYLIFLPQSSHHQKKEINFQRSFDDIPSFLVELATSFQLKNIIWQYML